MIGYSESIHEIAAALHLRFSDAMTMPDSHTRVMQLPTARIFLSRFEPFFQHFEASLSRVVGDKITVKNSNQAEAKWYHEKYLAFRRGVQLPRIVIEEAYLSMRDLIELFYEERFETLLHRAAVLYGG